MENIIYSWNFSDDKNRTKTWYIIAFSIVIGLTVWGIISKLYGLSFVIILITGVTLFVENNSPLNIEVKISDLGIKVSETFYDFGTIDSYSFIYNNESAVLLRLLLKKRGLKILNLKVNNKICLDLKELLPNYIEENPKGELSGIEKFINFLKL